jgi:hypothetical protein
LGDVEDYIREELQKSLDKTFADLPWWCMICGEGGNYDGERPDEFWFPPEEHQCVKKDPELLGLWAGKRIHPSHILEEE